MEIKTDVVIVGTGVGGAFSALNLPEDKQILMITKSDLESSDSFLAQGGMCMLKCEEDYDSYFEDTMKAGHFENDTAAVETMIKESPDLVKDLLSYGVDFQRDEDGNLVEEWTSTKDVHIIRGLVSGKKYILHEELAPLGYATASDVTFTVKEDGSVTKVKMKDEITKVDISKVDATTGKEIEGAKLTLKDKETGEVVESWTSGKEPHRIEGLTVSKTYVLHEDLAPAGYNVASDVEFTISDTGEVQKVVMKDEAKPVVVKTGDDSNISFYVAMGMFALGLIVCFYAKRKYGEKNDK